MQTELFNLTPPQDTHAQKFHAYNRAHPEIYWAIRAKAHELLDAGRDRLSMKGILSYFAASSHTWTTASRLTIRAC